MHCLVRVGTKIVEQVTLGEEDGWTPLASRDGRLRCPRCVSLLLNHTKLDFPHGLAHLHANTLVQARSCIGTASPPHHQHTGLGYIVLSLLLLLVVFVWVMRTCCCCCDGHCDNAGHYANGYREEDFNHEETRKRFCPHCRVLIQKIGGCDKMLCTSCGSRFSWQRAPIAFLDQEALLAQRRDDDSSPVVCCAQNTPRVRVEIPPPVRAWLAEYNDSAAVYDAQEEEEEEGVLREVCFVCKDRPCAWRFQACGHAMCQICCARTITTLGTCPFDRVAIESTPVPWERLV